MTMSARGQSMFTPALNATAEKLDVKSGRANLGRIRRPPPRTAEEALGSYGSKKEANQTLHRMPLRRIGELILAALSICDEPPSKQR